MIDNKGLKVFGSIRRRRGYSVYRSLIFTFLDMETIKIGRSAPGYSPDMAAKLFNVRRVKEIEKMYERNIPAFYRTLAKNFRLFDKALKIRPVFLSSNKEEVSLYFLWFHMETITFIYF